MAVLTRLNLPIKAMANLLVAFRTRTVENHRQGIRKKLHLGPDENLVTFLTGFGKNE